MLFTSIGVHYKFYGVGFCRKNTLFCFKGLHIASVKRLSAGLYLLYDPFLLS